MTLSDGVGQAAPKERDGGRRHSDSAPSATASLCTSFGAGDNSGHVRDGGSGKGTRRVRRSRTLPARATAAGSATATPVSRMSVRRR